MLAILFALTLYGAYAYFTQPTRLAQYTQQLIADALNLPVQIDSVEIDLNGNAKILGLQLHVPQPNGANTQIFSAQSIALQIDIADLYNGQVIPKSIIIDQPILSLIELDSGQFNYTILQNHFNAQKSPDDKPTPLPDQLPRIFIKNGLIRTGEIIDNKTKFLGAKAVSGTLIPQGEEPGQYWFGLYEHSPAQETNPSDPITTPARGTRLDTPSIFGEIDLRTLAVSTTVADLPFANLDQSLMPATLRTFWESLSPIGELKNIQFNLNPEDGFELIAEVHGVALTLLHLQDDDYTARMTDVNATFVFSDNQVTVKQLTGAIEDIHYEINGHYDGYSIDAPFTLELKTEPFLLTSQPTYSVAMPRAVTKVFEMFSPEGWVRVSSVIQRTKTAGPITTFGTTKIFSGRDIFRELIGEAPKEQWPTLTRGLTPDDPRLNSHGHFNLFPYELTNARGLIRFDEKHVSIESLTGDTPNGGTATITGELGPLNTDIGINVNVTALNIPFDEQLRDALKPHQQDALDMFFSQEHYDRLHARGHFVTPQQRQADQQFARHIQNLIEADQTQTTPYKQQLQTKLQALNNQLQKPIYTLGGRANIQVKVLRDIGPKQPINITTDIQFTNASVVFEHFPYPIRVTDGRMILSPQGIEFKNVTGAGLHGGGGTLNGLVPYQHNPDGSKYIDPDLHLITQNIPIDELLLDALPPQQKPWLQPLYLTGQLDIDGRIFLNDAKRIDIDMAIALKNGSITPGAGAFTINDVAGNLNLTLAGLKLQGLQGKRNDSIINIQGAADWADPLTASLLLEIQATDLNFKDPLLDLLSVTPHQLPILATLRDTYQPAGQFNANLTYQTKASQPPFYTLNITPANLAFTSREQRIELNQTQGSIQITPNLIQLQNLTGQFSTGDTLSLTGPIILTPNLHASLALQAASPPNQNTPTHISPQVLTLLPANLQALINTLQLRGAYNLNIPKLILNPYATTGPKTQFKGTVDLKHATANIGIQARDFNGRLAIDMTHEATEPWPRIAIGIQADQVTVLERPVTNFQMGVTSNDGSGELQIPKLSGDIANGHLQGRGHLNMASGDYQLEVSVRDAKLKQLIKQNRLSATTPTTIPPDSTVDGLVAASLALQGRWIDNSPIRGRGDIIIRDANLNTNPLMLGILRVTHFQLPSNETFNTANLNYYLDDGRFVFEQIGIRAPSMEIVGAGTLDWNTLDLDLTLTTQNPNGLPLGPLTPIIDGVRNQFVTILVDGTLNNPNLKARQFDGIKKTIKDILSNKN